MATHKVRPDPGALERQNGQQRRTIRRKVVLYGFVAAVVAVIAVVAVRVGFDSGERVPAAQQSGSATAPEAASGAGTVTFDGSSCSMEIAADRIEQGVVVFEVVNATDRRAMFDSYQLLDGYTLRAFEETIERQQRTDEGSWPSEREVTYLSSEFVPAHSSGFLASTMSPGEHGIVCLRPYEVQGIRPFASGIVGPIVVR